MRQFPSAILVAAVLLGSCVPARADGQDAKAILDKAIQALGGEEKLAKASTHSWKSKVKLQVGGEEREFSSQVTVKGLDQFRREFTLPQFKGLVIIDGEKGWRVGRSNTVELDGDALAKEKRNAYLQIIPITLLPLKGKGFKYELAGEEKVGDKPAVVLKVTEPDGKDFTLSFDKESSVPVKQVAKVIGGGGMESTIETTFLDYKDLGGIKKATKIVVKRDGEPSYELEISEFNILDKVDASTFAEPK
jgi:hypothetical protein